MRSPRFHPVLYCRRELRIRMSGDDDHVGVRRVARGRLRQLRVEQVSKFHPADIELDLIPERVHEMLADPHRPVACRGVLVHYDD